VRISGELLYQGETGKSYFVTAVNRDNAESSRSDVVTLK
jgi:hypothetical protein